MKAALSLIWEESYGSVTIDDICERAEVKKGSFYYFFESKADLALAALDRLWTEGWEPRLNEHFAPSVPPVLRMVNHVAWIHEKQAETKRRTGRVLGCPVCSVGSEVSTQEAKVSAKVRDICARKRRYFETAISDAVAQGAIPPCDPIEKAASLAALIEGVVSQGRIMNDPEVIAKLPAMLLDHLRVKEPVGVSA